MVVTFTQERKKQKKLIYIFIVLILATGFMLLWQGVFKKSLIKTEEISLPAVEPGEIEIDFNILERPILKELQPFKKIEAFQGEIGRVNPFLPY